MDNCTRLALAQKQRREILYWQARIGRQVIDTNNSLPLLRFKHRDNKQVTFHSVR